ARGPLTDCGRHDDHHQDESDDEFGEAGRPPRDSRTRMGRARISGSRRCGKMTQFARAASSAPVIWAATYPGTILQGNRPTAASPVVIAGLRWAPESPATAKTAAIRP